MGEPGLAPTADSQHDNNVALKPIDQTKNEEAEYELVPPDGGWGWLVLLGTVIINLLIPGTIKSFGVLFIEFLEVFNATPVAASWIPALCYFLYCSLGPLASYLSLKYSYRTVTLWGGFCAAAGMIMSYFANSITYLYVSYGVLVGIGAGLSFPPGIFIVTSYFVRYRGLANGVAISGSALGSIILPPFLRFLLETYGYRGAVLLMGGLTLNVWVAAMFYEPVQQHMKKVRVEKQVAEEKPLGTVVCLCETDSDTDYCKKCTVKIEPEERALLDVPQIKEHKDDGVLVIGSNGNVYKPESNRTRMKSLNEDSSDVSTPFLTVGSNPTIRKISSGLHINEKQYLGSTGQINRKVSTASRAVGLGVGSTSQISRKVSTMSRPTMGVGSNLAMNRKISTVSTSSFRYVSTAFHGSTLVGLHPEFSSQLTIKSVTEPLGWLSCCRKSEKDVKSTAKVQTKKEPGLLVTLLKDPAFIVILISNASNAIGYTNFTILLPAYALTLKFDKSQASYLLSVVAALDLVGRVGGSALSDWLSLDKRYYFVGGLLFSGISLALLPLATTYNSVCIFCAIFGLASGTYIGITAVIIVDMLGEDKLASSYGISLFINGVLQLIGPPVCGGVFQKINTYGPVFSGLGISLIIGAAVWGVIPFVKRKPIDS